MKVPVNPEWCQTMALKEGECEAFSAGALSDDEILERLRALAEKSRSE